MNTLDTREWLLTNGLGSYASGTVCDTRTRTYHGWLVVALEPPGQRTLLLSHLEASLEVLGQMHALGTNIWTGNKVEPWGFQLLQSFQADPIPTWTWGTTDWQLRRQIVMPDGRTGPEGEGTPGFKVPPDSGIAPPSCDRPGGQRILIQYHYTGKAVAVLRLRPVIGDRDFHHPQKEEPGLTFSQIVGPRQVLLQSLHHGVLGSPWQLAWSRGDYQPDEAWYWGFSYPEDAQRGLDCVEDLYSPGYLTVIMQPGDRLVVEARLGFPDGPLPGLESVRTYAFDSSAAGHVAEQIAAAPDALILPSFGQDLLKAGEQFMVQPRGVGDRRILAGYHWFDEHTRQTLLCIPGFLLASQRFAEARHMLSRIGSLCYQGLIPDPLPRDGSGPVYHNIDCALWWLEILGLYLEASQDWDFLEQQYGVVKQIYKAFTVGTLHNIRIDASDGLITWDAATVPLTWMDATVQGHPVTLRNGKPIEINALWYSALCWAGQWATQLGGQPESLNNDPLSNQARRYTQQAQQVKAALRRFWNYRQNYLFDRIAPDDRLDSSIRPNAVLAVSLYHCAFTAEQAQQVLQVARDRLLTPYGLRTLAPDDSAYVGHYQGNQFQRDRAYHQGTVWSWLLGPFIRSWRRFHPVNASLPMDLQPLMEHFYQQACFRSISELFDGEAPHAPRGAVAYALPVAELLRCWKGFP